MLEAFCNSQISVVDNIYFSSLHYITLSTSSLTFPSFQGAVIFLKNVFLSLLRQIAGGQKDVSSQEGGDHIKKKLEGKR